MHPLANPLSAKDDIDRFLAALPSPCLVLLPDTPRFTIVAANDAYLQATMTRREEIVARGVFDAFPDDPNSHAASGARSLAASLGRVLATGAPDRMAVQRYDVARPDGTFEERHWSPANAPVLSKGGAVGLILHHVEDVTEFVRLRERSSADQAAAHEAREAKALADIMLDDLRAAIRAQRASDRALRAERERLRLVLDSATDYAILAMDMDRRINLWNEGATQILGWTMQEVMGRSADMIFLPEDCRRGVPEQEAEAALRDGRMQSERWHMRKDGTHFWATDMMLPLRNPDADPASPPIGLLKIMRDETAWRQAEARRASVLASMSEGFLVLDRDFRIIELNAEGLRIDGRPETEIIGRTHWEVWPASIGTPVEAAYRRVMAERVPTAVEHHYLSDAHDVRLEIRIYPVPDGVAAFFRDITERRNAEDRQTLLAREVDHRAKNALAVVQSTLRLTRADSIESYRTAVEGRIAALARAQTLLSNEQWAGADLRSLVEGELAPFLDKAERVRVRGTAVALPVQMTQPFSMVLHELATNAVKYGALSVPDGVVSVAWAFERASGLLRLHWSEAGGPSVDEPPTRRGFGSRVLDATVRGQLGGDILLNWQAGGLACELKIPLNRHKQAS